MTLKGENNRLIQSEWMLEAESSNQHKQRGKPREPLILHTEAIPLPAHSERNRRNFLADEVIAPAHRTIYNEQITTLRHI